MLLVTSICSALVVGIVGYQSGKDSLQNAAFNQLTQVRESRTREIGSFFDQLKNSMVLYTRGATAIQAVQGFTAGFDELQSAAITPAQNTALTDYYQNVFIKGLEGNTGNTSDPAGFMPTSPAQKYLQANYTAPYSTFAEAIKVDDAGDGSAWSATHAEYHDYFRELTQRFAFEDALLLDTRGNVVYSAYSGADLGTNIETGPYRDSNLADAYTSALASNAVDYAGLTDFGRYQPSYGVPTAWAVSPLGSNGVVSGVLALQLPLAAINDLMTGSQGWEEEGLGETGETYLAGPDETMRSVSRMVLQDPERYRTLSIAAGEDPTVAAKAASVKGTVLLQDTRTTAVQNALRGQTGTIIGPDYLGQEALIAYAPLEIEGLRWVIVAKISTSEAFQPVADFSRNMVLATAAMIFLVCLASLILAQVFVRPVRRLVTGVRQVAAGDLTVQVPVRSKDEFGDLGGAFNDMSRTLRTKQDLLDEQQAENDRLLLTLMPEAVARRYRTGEETISQDHQDVSVVFADIVGFEALTAAQSSAQSLALLNDLVRSFDEAAARLGVEKIRTLRTGYLASCGLTVPRVDHSRRAVEFAIEMHNIITRFNLKGGTNLSLRAGVDTGTVTSGLVGRSTVVYDMWGDAVNLANQIQGLAGRPGIFVTGRIYDQMRDVVRFSPAGDIDTTTGQQPVWRVETDGS
jgi:class 3 adenylate cyclase